MDSSTSVGTCVGVLMVALIINNNDPRGAKGKMELVEPKNQTLMDNGEIITLATLFLNITYHIL